MKGRPEKNGLDEQSEKDEDEEENEDEFLKDFFDEGE